MYVTVSINRILALFLVLACAAAGVLTCMHVDRAQPVSAEVQEESVQLPIIMYHSMLKEGKGKYIISPDTFEGDLRYLKDNGYTTIVMQDLLNYVYKGEALPEKPVMLTFDDGYYNNYLYAFPLAKQYESKIVISPIGYYTDQFSKADANHATYSHITWDQIKEMMGSGYVEFQNHTYNLHASDGKRLGAKQLRGESLEAYTALLTEDINTMQREMQEHTGYTPTTFVYPFGAISDAAVPIVRSLGFSATLTCESRVNTITRDPEGLYGLGRHLRPPGQSSESFFKKLAPPKERTS